MVKSLEDMTELQTIRLQLNQSEEKTSKVKRCINLRKV